MDKVFITKSELAQSFDKRRKNAGPFLLSVTWLWVFFSIILCVIPSILLLCVLLIMYLPFYWVDQAIIRRRDNV